MRGSLQKRTFKGTVKQLWQNPNKKAKLHLLRQSNVCALCGKPFAKMDDATVDHIIPLSKGGRDTPDNMQLAHNWCNQTKGNKTNVE